MTINTVWDSHNTIGRRWTKQMQCITLMTTPPLLFLPQVFASFSTTVSSCPKFWYSSPHLQVASSPAFSNTTNPSLSDNDNYNQHQQYHHQDDVLHSQPLTLQSTLSPDLP